MFGDCSPGGLTQPAPADPDAIPEAPNRGRLTHVIAMPAGRYLPRSRALATVDRRSERARREAEELGLLRLSTAEQPGSDIGGRTATEVAVMRQQWLDQMHPPAG